MVWEPVILGVALLFGAVLLVSFRDDAREGYLGWLRRMRLQPVSFMPPGVVVWIQVAALVVIGVGAILVGASRRP